VIEFYGKYREFSRRGGAGKDDRNARASSAEGGDRAQQHQEEEARENPLGLPSPYDQRYRYAVSPSSAPLPGSVCQVVPFVLIC
jgi:hypothetical protein